MAKLFANSGDPDQTPRSAASDPGLRCVPSTILRVSRLQWVKSLYWHQIFTLGSNVVNLNDCSAHVEALSYIS